MKQSFFLWLSVTVIVSVLASIVSSVYTNRALENYLLSLDADSQFFSQSEPVSRPLPGSYEEALATIEEIQNESVGFAYSNDTVLLEGNAFASGVTLSNDGWMIFSEPIPSDSVIVVNNSVFTIDSTVEGPENIQFVKVNSSQMTPVAFADPNTRLLGSIHFYLNESRGVQTLQLEQIQHTPEPILDYTFGNEWTFSEAMESGLVFNSSARFLGLQTENRFIPVHQIDSAIRQTLREQQINQVGMGIVGVNAETIVRGGDQDVQSGFIISRIGPSSPAVSAGLEIGDVIIAIDRISLSETDSLAALLHDYEVNDSVEVQVLRNGERLRFDVELQSVDSIRY